MFVCNYVCIPLLDINTMSLLIKNFTKSTKRYVESLRCLTNIREFEKYIVLLAAVTRV